MNEEHMDLTEIEITKLQNLIQKKDRLLQEDWEYIVSLLDKKRLYLAVISIDQQKSTEEFFKSIIKDEDGNICAFTTEELCHDYLDEHPSTPYDVWAASLPFPSMGMLAEKYKVRVLIDRDSDRFLGYDGKTREFWIYVADKASD